MDGIQLLVVDLGWFFFAAWTTALIAVSLVAFGSDILEFANHSAADKKP
jgi:hypothetical protein